MYSRYLSLTGATIRLQELRDHTTKRLMKDESVVPPENARKLKLTIKYDCDVTSGKNPYQHNSKTCTESTASSIFLVSMIPLCLKDIKDSLHKSIWQNRRPSSPENCLPISFQRATYTEKTVLSNQQKYLVSI